MRFQLLVLILVLISQISYAQGRKPAVEDFVGIDVVHPEATPQGTENLFNFEKDIDQFQKTSTIQEKKNNSQIMPPQKPNEFIRYAVVFLALSLPAVLSLLVMKRMKNKAREDNLSNIKVLEEFRRHKLESKKSDEDIRKVS